MSIKGVLTIQLIGILLLKFQSTSAQNLVPNPSFEDDNICVHYEVPCTKAGWKNEFGSMIQFIDGHKKIKARTGKVVAYLKPWHATKDEDRRHFLQTPLICPLKRSYKYDVSLYVKPKHMAVTELAIWFSDSIRCGFKDEYSPLEDSKELLEKEPQIIFKNFQGIYNREIDSQNGERKWLKLEFTYTAQGFEKVMFLGNFQHKNEIDLFPIPKDSMDNHSLYLIDDVSITPLDPSAITDCCYEANLQTIYDDNYRHSCPDPLPDYWTCHEDSKIEVGKPFVMENINFKPNEAVLLEKAKPELDSLANYLSENPSLSVKINGHTDSVGTHEYNIQLSEERAKAVKGFLVEKGIDASRLEANGYGFTKPVATNTTEQGRRKNRRVEFLLTDN